MKMNKSREATPKQVGQLYDLARETKSGAFGMPANPVNVSKEHQIHDYHLLQVEDLPYGHQGDVKELTDPGSDLANLSSLETPILYRSRLFWPSLEVAMGLRQAGSGMASTAVQEVQAIASQWSSPLFRAREINEYGYPLTEAETPPLGEHQSFDSAYASNVGKHILDLHILRFTDASKDELSERYSVEYKMSKLPPQDDRWRPGYSLKDPNYGAEISLRSADKPARIKTSRYIKRLGPLALKQSYKVLQRDEADNVLADLQRVKDIYSQWS